MFKNILLLGLKCILSVGGYTKIGLFFFLPQIAEAMNTERHWRVRICQGNESHELLSLPKAVAATLAVGETQV